MENRTRVFLIVVAAILIITIGGIGYLLTSSSGSGETGLADAAGRPVIVPQNLDRGIITVGATDPLRLLSYFNMNEYVREVDEGDVKDLRHGRAYSYAYDYTGLPYHADNTLSSEDVERISKIAPSLVIVASGVYGNYKKNVEGLAKMVPVVVLHRLPQDGVIWDDNYALSDIFVKQLDLLGAALGRQDRADALKVGINGILSEIRESVRGKTCAYQSIYVAGVTYSGSNPLTDTFPSYAPLALVGGENAYSSASASPKVSLTVEQVSGLGMDLMLVDPSSSDKIVGHNGSQGVMHHIVGKNRQGAGIRTIVALPIVWDGVNYDCALACAYHLSHVLYGVGSPDDVKNKVSGLFSFFYGDNGGGVLDGMASFFEQKSKSNSVEMPLMAEIKISGAQGSYRFVQF
jgi:iron complex transport system substrate-binding protein